MPRSVIMEVAKDDFPSGNENFFKFRIGGLVAEILPYEKCDKLGE